jgi:hypothetical protein
MNSLCASNECPPVVELMEDGRIAVNGKAHTADEFGEFVAAVKDGRYDGLLA